MRAKLIVRKPNGDIARVLDLSSLDEANVTEQVKNLRETVPADYVIDMSQVEAARKAAQASFVDISTITEYGLTQRLSNAVRCF